MNSGNQALSEKMIIKPIEVEAPCVNRTTRPSDYMSLALPLSQRGKMEMTVYSNYSTQITVLTDKLYG